MDCKGGEAQLGTRSLGLVGLTPPLVEFFFSLAVAFCLFLLGLDCEEGLAKAASGNGAPGPQPARPGNAHGRSVRVC